MLALIENDTIVNHSILEGKKVRLPNGDFVIPAKHGWARDGFQLRTVLPNLQETPEGKRVSTTTTTLIDGEPTSVCTYEDIPDDVPTDFPLNKVQFKAALQFIGLTVGDVHTAIDQLPITDLEKTIAKLKVTDSDLYRRDNALFAALAAPMGVTGAEIDAAWLQAKDIH